MDELEQLLKKFWANTTTDEETKKLRHLLLLHKNDFASRFIENYDQLQESVLQHISLQKADKMLADIHNRSGISKATSVPAGKIVSMKYRYRYAAVAAGIIIMIGLAGSWFYENNKTTLVQPQTLSLLITTSNRSDTAESVTLQDGSSVNLEPYSSISYQPSFTVTRREIYLSGTAVFKVAKDRARPFTVYAGNIATTALGTTFRVIQNDSLNGIAVQLFEGKVAVKQKGQQGKESYLLPGQQFVFNALKNTYVINELPKKSGADLVTQRSSSAQCSAKETNALLFKAVAFNKVIAILEKEYHATIVLQRPNAGRINVTAAFERTDSLITILNTITSLNGLTVVQQGKVYSIQ